MIRSLDPEETKQLYLDKIRKDKLFERGIHGNGLMDFDMEQLTE